jgi:hypothetical protein
MNPQPDNKLEADLARLTVWDGDAPEVWRAALAAASVTGTKTTRWFAPRWALGAIGMAAALVVFVGLLPSLATEHSRARTYEPKSAAGPSGPSPAKSEAFVSPSVGDAADVARNTEGEGRFSTDNTESSPSRRLAPPSDAGGGRAAVQSPASPATTGRQIVHKATIELLADDVRAAFLKAGQLASEAHGEYVQNSALTGADDKQLQANLTLRVAAERLSDVLNELRQLGKVRSERNDGEDVTSQAVDLDARLRNEQRVEAELLNLLESRKDAALKDILDLRANLAGVRNVIEQLTAQRQNLVRLVSLATVLVIIRPSDTPAVPPPTGIGAYFGDAISTMWHKGLRVLADTLAMLLAALIGGLPWWILLAATLLLFRSVRRKSHVNRDRRGE